MKYSLAELGQATNARIEYIDAATEFVTGIQTDSRLVKSGDLFVAIKGENFDGHDFVDEAFENGAVAAMVSSPIEDLSLLVDDTLIGLGKLAKYHRHNLNAKVIAITGSSGKTSTKDLLAATLRNFGNTIAPPGSFNNEIGLPTTILSADSNTDFLVLEMGMRGLGHIDYLCEISAPNVSAVLNVGSAHMELLGSREAIATAKGEILKRLKESDTAVLFADDPLVNDLGQTIHASQITFGQSELANVRISKLVLDESAKPSFDLTYNDESHRITLGLVGEHQAFNAACVAAICISLKLDFAKVCQAISNAKVDTKWRMEVTELPNGVTIVNDAYNANTESMRAGLKALKAMAGDRRTWAVLGQMRELGSESEMAHDEIGRLCVRLDINRLIAVGPGAKLIQMGASLEGSWDNESAYVDKIDDAIQILKSELKSGDIVYLKASRAIGLESVASALTLWASGEEYAAMRLVLIAGGISLVLSLILTPIFAKFLRQKGLAQAIRQSSEDVHYPDHETKVGTPAMGGAVILFSLLVGYTLAHVITFRVPSYSSFVALFLTFALGAVGFADDYLKIFKQKSSGIRARTKFIGQIVSGAAFAWMATQNPSIGWLNPTNSTMPPASQAISFVRDTGFVLPAGLFAIWVIFIVVSTTNAVNLTDGLDGLATGAAVMSFGAYTVISVWQYGQSCVYEIGPRCYSVADPFDLSVFAAAFAGALLGFLWYNTSPAQIFMGDTGSLAIGGGLAALAIMSKTQMLLPLIGILFVATAVSVILQVGSFKLRGKRIFRMAPLHHHFELLGWHEVTIVVRFWLIHALGVALAIAIFYAEWIRQ